MIRIQGGRFKGRRLQQPASAASRPTSAKLRASLFSTLGEELRGRWADLFCGVGGFGIEALGRGAEHCTFVDLEPLVLRAAAANLERLEVPGGSWKIQRADARRWLGRLSREPGSSFAGIFADPPYGPDDPGLLLPIGWALVVSGRVGCFILEHAAEAELPPLEAPSACSIRTRRQGAAAFTLIEGGSR